MKRKKDSHSYMKFLAVIDTIQKYGDEKNPLSIKDIQNHIYERFDFELNFRLIQKYMEEYNEYFDDNCIECMKKGRNNYYYFLNTSLDMMEAKAIVDLVYSSDFFTMKTKDNYKSRIQNMFSHHYQSYFDKVLNGHIVKNENDQVFYQELEVISEAIYKKKKIRFTYLKPQLEHHDNKSFELAPIDTCFANNEYYLLCQGNKNKDECIQFRLDYVRDVEIIEDSSVSFNAYQIQCFQDKLNTISYMYGDGQLETIELDFDESVYPNMIDKFGKNIRPHKVSDHIYRVQVKYTINSTFYSWMIGFGGKIRISGNDKQKETFEQFLMSFIDIK